MSERSLTVAIGVTAHNEEQNIGTLLARLRTVSLGAETRIIVVASGCTDGTVPIVERARRQDPRIQLVIEPERRGKAAAINQLLALARDADVIVGESADTLPDPGAIERMVAHFADPSVGMVGSRPVPEDDAGTFLGYCTQLLWRLHHAVATRSPKQGELVAWRNVVPELPPDAIADEAYLEAELTRLGYRLVYEPGATVRNRGPATLGAFITQRRRNHCIHRTLAASTRYRPATRDHLLLARLGISELLAHPTRAHWLAAASIIELWASVLGLWDHRVARRDHALWEMVEGTKGLAETGLDDLPQVTAVVLAPDARDDPAECLASLSRQRYRNLRVIVVASGSAGPSAGDLEVLAIPGGGTGDAFNAGVTRAIETGSRYVVALRADTVVARDFVEHAVAVAVAAPRAASVSGPVFYYDEPERLWYAGASIAWWFGKTFHVGRRVIWGPASREPRLVGYSVMAATLYATAALRTVGGFDRAYHRFFDESDWCVRASRAGWHHHYAPGPKSWRRISGDTGERSALDLYFLFRNNIRFMRRNARPWHWPTFALFFVLESLARYTLASLVAPQRGARLLAIGLAVRDAARGRYGAGSADRIARSANVELVQHDRPVRVHDASDPLQERLL